MKNKIRNRFITFRITEDWVARFDLLCEKLGSRRSQVARYALNAFMRATSNDSDAQRRIRSELL